MCFPLIQNLNDSLRNKQPVALLLIRFSPQTNSGVYWFPAIATSS